MKINPRARKVLSVIATSLVFLALPLLVLSFFAPTSGWAATLLAWSLSAVLFAFLFYLSAAFLRTPDNEREFRHAAYQAAGFLILAFSVRAFGLHDASMGLVTHLRPPSGHEQTVELGPSHTPRAIAELSAIMILFILVEIAAFVARDVEQARSEVTRAARDAQKMADRMSESVKQVDKLALVTSINSMDVEVQSAAVPLINYWSTRAPLEKDHKLSTQCWTALLRKYLEEEHRDFCFSGDLEGIPASVQPGGHPPKDYENSDVSYIATNVGFYARLFAELVSDLHRYDENRKVCVAVITNVLPAHWWNWTFSNDEWREYSAISEAREQMEKIAAPQNGNPGAQVDRIIAVREDSPSVPSEPSYAVQKSLWSEQLLYDMLSNWQLLSDKNKKPLSSVFMNEGTFGSDALQFLPPTIAKGGQSAVAGAMIYPMLREQHPTLNAFTTNTREFIPTLLRDEYAKLLGKDGKYWVLRIKEEGVRHFARRFDATFIGLGAPGAGKGECGLWGIDDENDVDWGLCLMASLDATVETMFLSVISGDSVKRQYRWWRKELEGHLNWTSGRLPDAALKRRPPKPRPAAPAYSPRVRGGASDQPEPQPAAAPE